jgi:hypothetical protein
MRDKSYKRFLFKEAVDVSGKDIFANAEVMTPAEFVRDYGAEESQEMTNEQKFVSLYEIIFEAKKGYQKRFPKPPQTVLTPDGDIKGAEVSPEKLSDILAVRAKKGALPSNVPFIHPSTAAATIVPAGSLAKGKRETKQEDDIVVVDEQNKPIDLDVLSRKLTDYSNPKFKLLKQNEKMKKSSTGEYEAFYNIGIPAIMGMVFDEKENKFKIINTCPSAGSCIHVCYATKGGYVQFQAVSERQNLTLNLLYNHPDKYIDKAVDEIVKVVKAHATPTKELPRGIKTIIRWHDAGDFFSEDYLRLSLHIIERVKDALPSFYHDFIQFYAYTKRAKMVEPFQDKGLLLRKSIGAKPEEEREIHPEKDLFSQIVPKSVKDDMLKQDVIERIGEGEEEGKFIVKPGKDDILKKAIKNSPEVKFKNSYPMLTMAEYEDIEDTLKRTKEKVNVIILPGENDRPAKDPNVAGVYLMFH